MRNLYGRLWRWHFFAALLVVPFVLWQSVTGTLYLWSEWWMDRAHPQLRFVEPARAPLPLSEQIQAALGAVAGGQASGAAADAALTAAGHAGVADAPRGHAHHGGASSAGLAVQRVLLPDDPTRSTTVLFQHGNSLPFPVFVNPNTGVVLGQLSGTAWLPGMSRALHGGWPLGQPGSWLLELGDGWAILMLATGLYLWWPRGRGIAALWPRTGAGARVLLRDLHSCVAVWFSAVFLFFLISALPWTAFWGNTLLQAIETNTGQSSPAGFSPGGASVAQFSNASLPIEQAVAAARRTGVHGTLDIRLAPWPGAPVFMTNIGVLPSQDRTVVADPDVGSIRGDFTNAQIPVIPRLVALGVHVHQADFGPVNVWLNTAFAASLIWLTVTGILSWWNRRPAGKLGAPPKVTTGIPVTVQAILVAACVLMPLFGASVLLILLAESIPRLHAHG
ncbi:MAG: PepSY domain-containing protein [Proteobacteria bacterium]|nr:PepSY domain-containing protein [Pseudomonadota bacterium]